MMARHRLLPIQDSWFKDSLDVNNTAWVGKKQRLAEGLVNKKRPLLAKGWVGKIDRDQRMDTMGSVPLSKRLYQMSQKEGAKQTMFERYVLTDLAEREIDERHDQHRKATDVPLMDENPYSTGVDYRMGGHTRLVDLVPIIATRMRFATPAAVATVVSRLAKKYPTVGDLLTLIHLDRNGAATGMLLDKHGEIFRHIELFARCVGAQEEMRRHLSRSNLQGKFRSEVNGDRVYALPGTYRLSRGSAVKHTPGFSGDSLVDTGSYGAWGWFSSDFGRDPAKFKKSGRQPLVQGARGSEAFLLGTKGASRTLRTFYGGRVLAKLKARQTAAPQVAG